MAKKDKPFDIYRIRLKGGGEYEILEEPYPSPPPSPPKDTDILTKKPKFVKIRLPTNSATKRIDKPQEQKVIKIKNHSQNVVSSTVKTTTSQAASVPSVSSRPKDKKINKNTETKKVFIPVTIVRPSNHTESIPSILYVKEKKVHTSKSGTPKSSEPNESINLIAPSDFLKQFDGPVTIRKYPESLPPTNEQSKSVNGKCSKCHRSLKKGNSKNSKTRVNPVEESKVRVKASTSREKLVAKSGSQQGPSSKKVNQIKSAVFKVPAVPPLPRTSPLAGKRKRMSSLPFTGDIYAMETLFKRFINREVLRIAPFERFKAVIDRHVKVIAERRTSLLQAYGSDFFLKNNVILPGVDKKLMEELTKQWRGLARTRVQVDELLFLSGTVKKLQELEKSNVTIEEIVISDDSD